MADQVVLAIGHGSRTAEAIAEFHRFADQVSRRIDRPVGSCFLELAAPDLATGLIRAAASAGAGGQVVALPVFLGGAGHHKNDVASVLQRVRPQFPAVEFRYAAPLGMHAKLVELLDLRVRETLADDASAMPLEETSLLVVGRGSTDPGANSELCRLAYLAGDGRPYLSAEFAFQAAARPTIEEGLRRCRQLGARQALVAPFLLFTGRVYDDIQAASKRGAEAHGLRVLVARYLDSHPLLIDVAVQRLQEAIDGHAAMNCDLCKYRFAMAGHEEQVGQAHTIHEDHGESAHEEEPGRSHAHSQQS